MAYDMGAGDYAQQLSKKRKMMSESMDYTRPKDSTPTGIGDGIQSTAQGLSSGKGLTGSLGGGLTTAGVASGNPYLAAAGLGLSAFSAVQKQKQEEKENEYKDMLARNRNQMNAINSMINAARGMRL